VESNSDTSPGEEAQQSAQGSPSILFIALIGGALLLGYLSSGVVLHLRFGIQLPRWCSIIALFLIVHVCTYYFAKRVGRRLLTQDLTTLSAGCSIAFVLFDEGLSLVLGWTGFVSESQAHPIATALGAVVVDVLVVVAIVFLTVPLGARLYGRAKVA
jgi:hypothetical protein